MIVKNLRVNAGLLMCCACLMYGAPPAAASDTGETGLSGIVESKDGQEKLVGAVVVPDGNMRAAVVTDVNGKFRLPVSGVKSIKISCLGYVAKIIQVDGKGLLEGVSHAEGGSDWIISLDEDNFKIDEVVVTGQGAEINKRRLSSNVATVSAKDLEAVKLGRIDQMLQDALPNVQINMSTGQPGSTSVIKSRGLSSAFTNSTPVIYVDGVRVDNLNTGATLNNELSGNSAVSGSIGDIPTENIDHIEFVTGGAATTLYGSDAANGVIQIFTRKGSDRKTAFYAGMDMGVDIASSQFYHFRRTKELLHLMRQEIFFGEGRRAADLGIRFPVCEVEAANTPSEGYTDAQIPPFIPLNQDMDAFTIDKAAKTVTIKYNMNRVIVENKQTDYVVPFIH